MLILDDAGAVTNTPRAADFTVYPGSASTGLTLTDTDDGVSLSGDWPGMAVMPAPTNCTITARLQYLGLASMGLTTQYFGLICRAGLNGVPNYIEGYAGVNRFYNSNNSWTDIREVVIGNDTVIAAPLVAYNPADAGTAYRTQQVWLQMRAEGTTISVRTVLADPIDPTIAPTWPPWQSGIDASHTTGWAGIYGFGSIDTASIELLHFGIEEIV